MRFDDLDNGRARLKVLGVLEVLDGHKGLDDLKVIDRSRGIWRSQGINGDNVLDVACLEVCD